MITRWLTDDLMKTLDRAPCAPVVLWFNKEREYERLLDVRSGWKWCECTSST